MEFSLSLGLYDDSFVRMEAATCSRPIICWHVRQKKIISIFNPFSRPNKMWVKMPLIQGSPKIIFDKSIRKLISCVFRCIKHSRMSAQYEFLYKKLLLYTYFDPYTLILGNAKNAKEWKKILRNSQQCSKMEKNAKRFWRMLRSAKGC